ncbi:MAG: hypothetical protein J0L92_18490 [Deltaproteobacteria bacterium]|nr:hypothetical protein [Deltaproteobacteria bacterium]
MVALATSYVGAAISIVKGIVLVPMYLDAFGVDVYGAWLASANVVGLLAMFDVGISAVVAQRLATQWGAADRESFARTTAAAVPLVLVVFVAMAGVGVAVAARVPQWIQAPADSHAALSLTFAMTAVGAAGALALGNVLAVPSAWQRTEIAAAARLGGQIVDIVVIVVGLLSGLGVTALGLGSVASAVVGLGIALVWSVSAWRSLGLPFQWAPWGEVLAFVRLVLPNTVSRIALQIGANVEVAFVSALISPTAAAVYALTDRTLRVAMGFVTPIANSVMSALSHFHGEKGAAQMATPVRELLAIWAFVVSATIPVVIVINADFIGLWVGGDQFGGTLLNVLLGAAGMLGARELVSATVLTASGKIRESAFIATLEVGVRVPATFFALHAFGVLGMPIASGLVSVLFLVIYGYAINDSLGLRGSTALRLHASGATAALVGLGLAAAEAAWLPATHSWPAFLLKASLVGLLHLATASALQPTGRRAIWARLAARLPRRAAA